MKTNQKSTRVKDAYTAIKVAIRSNQIPAGFQATEAEFATRLGMSRTPVREALIRLEAEGLVEMIQRRGARVLPIRTEDMREIYDILMTLEPEAAANLAVRNISQAQLEPLAQATTEMESALAQDEPEIWAEADDRFHMMLLDMSDNRRLRNFVRSLHDQAHRARMITLRLRSDLTQSTREHREIMRHIIDGEADAVRALYRQHRARSSSEILRILDTYRLVPL
ncbi:MAG: GntR family transcriptional regulator [Roseivivax sp.]|nr:GntR family transcriptional regulator [Roseivivax sp.]